MKSTAEEQDSIRQYLLGLLPQERLPALEERLLTDEAFFREILIAEDELIDRYLVGRVSLAERDGFESHFLVTPERRKKLRFARALRRCVAERGAAGAAEFAEEPSGDEGEAPRPYVRRPAFLSALWARSPALTYSLAAAALLLLLVGSWVWMSGGWSRREPQRVLAVTLSPGLAREGGEVTKVRVGADDEEVRFSLRLEGDEYRSYNATLLSADGSAVLTREGLTPEPSDGGKAVVFRAPTKSLPPGDYQLKLAGLDADHAPESLGSYPFRVLRP